jgi:hypothetical protein
VTLSPARSAAEVLKASDSPTSGAVANVADQPERWITTNRHDHGFGPGHNGSGT